jgi:hypothetical protein
MYAWSYIHLVMRAEKYVLMSHAQYGTMKGSALSCTCQCLSCYPENISNRDIVNTLVHINLLIFVTGPYV